MSKKHKKIVDWSGSEKQEYMRVKEDFFNHNWEIVDEKNITNILAYPTFRKQVLNIRQTFIN